MGPEFLILIAVFALMMWLMSRGAKKQRQAAADLRSNLELGQQVMTASGFFGTVVDIDGDVITLESSPGIETMWKREAIHAVTEPPFAVVAEDDDVEDDADQIEVPDDASSLIASTEEPVERPDTVERTDTPDDAGRQA
ncbi:preprotein translocase subunit YajC [Georgenia sunbinii]|uniref:preprotein translocase subunit YajC n=1 Tax=Georgenia sunbinii TaxID=3117728 RepID=UPI002F266F2D